MHPLIHQLTTASHFDIRSPFLIIAWSAADSIRAADVNQFTYQSLFDPGFGLYHSGMMAMIKAAFEFDMVAPGGLYHLLRFPRIYRQGFLAEHMLTIPHGGNANLRMRIRRSADNHDIYVFPGSYLFPASEHVGSSSRG
jgi:hypothetical protein